MVVLVLLVHAGRIFEAAANAALNAVPQAVVAAVPQIIASAEVVPTQAGDAVKVIVEGKAVE